MCSSDIKQVSSSHLKQNQDLKIRLDWLLVPWDLQWQICYAFSTRDQIQQYLKLYSNKGEMSRDNW
jgi:hypothetical protein